MSETKLVSPFRLKNESARSCPPGLSRRPIAQPVSSHTLPPIASLPRLYEAKPSLRLSSPGPAVALPEIPPQRVDAAALSPAAAANQRKVAWGNPPTNPPICAAAYTAQDGAGVRRAALDEPDVQKRIQIEDPDGTKGTVKPKYKLRSALTFPPSFKLRY